MVFEVIIALLTTKGTENFHLTDVVTCQRLGFAKFPFTFSIAGFNADFTIAPPFEEV